MNSKDTHREGAGGELGPARNRKTAQNLRENRKTAIKIA